MSIHQFLMILWARKGLLLLSLAACLIGALIVIKLVPARYDASSRVMLEIVRPDPVTGEALSSTFARAYVQTQTELIKDYRVAGRVVDAFNWTGSPALSAAYQASGSDMDFRRWLAQRVIDRTEAQLIPGSNILEITYSGEQPEPAALIADALRQAYADQTLTYRQQGALRNAEWFRNQTGELRRRLTAAEERKADFERANNIVLQDDNSDAESARLAALAAASSAAQISMPSAPVVAPSQAQLAQVDAAIAVAQRTLGPNHPDLIAMRQQRAAVAEAVQRELAAGRAAQGGGPSGPSAGALFNAQQQRVLAQRGKVAEARQLMVDVSVLREQLSRTAARAAQLEQESESTETGLTFLGNATVPAGPTFPKPLPVLLGGLALGAALGVLVSLIVELLNRRVRTRADLQVDDVPVIGMMAHPPKPRPRWMRLPFSLPFSRRLQPS